jgi:type IV pilus assembly protein PilB
MKKTKRIGDLLVQSGLVKKKYIEEALEIQKKRKRRIGEILLEFGCINSRTLTRKLCEQVGLTFVELGPEMFDRRLIEAFPYPLLYVNNVVPLYEVEDKLYFAIGDPTNLNIVTRLRRFTEKDIVLFGAEPIQINRLLIKA